MDQTFRMVRLAWNREKEELHLVDWMKGDVGYVSGMCYVQQHDLLILASDSPGFVQVTRLSEGSPMWNHNK